MLPLAALLQLVCYSCYQASAELLLQHRNSTSLLMCNHSIALLNTWSHNMILLFRQQLLSEACQQNLEV